MPVWNVFAVSPTVISASKMTEFGLIDRKGIFTATTVVEEISPVEIRLFVAVDRVVDKSVETDGGEAALDAGRV